MDNIIYFIYYVNSMRYNPFNPQQPARPDFFVGREPEIKEFEGFLSQTIHASPMNMSITGNRGMGKTSILSKFEEIARNDDCIVLRMSNYEGNISNIIDLTDYITTNLKREIISRSAVKNGVDTLLQWTALIKPTFQWNDISLSIEQRQVIQEAFRDRLLKLWKEVKGEYKAIVILIDEAESLERTEGALTFLREVFQRISIEANFMLVLAGKLNFPERMSESFSPLNRYFPSQRLMPFNEQEIREYVIKKLATVKVGVDDEALKTICNLSEGHPYVLVAMCYLIFDSLREGESHITNQVLLRSKEKINARLAQDFFAPMFHPLTPKAKEIMKKIADRTTKTRFSFKDSVDWSGMDKSYVSPYIQELLRKGILNKPERGQYEVFHGLFLEYVKSI